MGFILGQRKEKSVHDSGEFKIAEFVITDCKLLENKGKSKGNAFVFDITGISK